MGAAMLLGSCQERLGDEGNIGFTADVASYKGYNAGTKAAPIGDPLNQPDTYEPLFQTTYGSAGFNVKAYKGTDLRIDGTSKFTNGDWNLDQNAKWYSGEVLDFYAIAPVNNRGITDVNVDPATKKMTFTYKVQTNKGVSQPDVMVGYYSGTGVESTTPGKRIAPLTFYHPLAAVRFKAGDLADSPVRSVAIEGLCDKGTATIDMANMGSAGAVVWTLDPSTPSTAVSGFPFDPAITPAEGEYLGGSESAMMVIPQVLSEGAVLRFEVDNPDADDDPATDDETISYIVSLKDVELKAGTILDITINYKGILLERFDEQPLSMVLPWVEQQAVEYNDFRLVPKTAYLTSGPAFNAIMKSFVTDPLDLVEIVFDRGGQVDEDGVEIQDPTRTDGYPIYAKYDAATKTVRISTHANEIKTHQDCSEMFKDLCMENIQWGMFFDTTETTDMNSMFMNCSYVKRLNFINVLNTVNVTDFSHMFDGCGHATNILLGNEFDTKKATDLSYMFNECRRLQEIDLGSKFDTRNVTDMSYMFCNCSSFTYMEVGEKFYTYKVRDFSYMFYNIGVHHLHFNSRFAIKSQYSYLEDHDVPVATNMMYNALSSSGRRAVYITSRTFNWLRDTANGANWNINHDGWGTTGLPQIVLPTD